ncbi:Excalibur calcium-binding domain-containing protein [Nannocystis exedens]|uniref:Excalibur calcium-binding domain-containing protein n=1 Tax=Nannocystis exedens TaxID=54 RepID=A0A1I2ELW5_9BACT|nr:DUF1524 domain-containing protein [Nannocystis exedens]PCC73974.1 calcium-binding protein [Nannocystis exedens]SFE93371.1 Excalibur calcium-binding domain-containing protein [Nannocystis exedens]
MPAPSRLPLAALVVPLLLGCVPGEPAAPTGHLPAAVVVARPDDRAADASEPAGTRLAVPLLASLPVRPQKARPGYAREQFGHAWSDVDRNGCDTRDDILRRDLQEVQLEPGKRPCVVTAGALADPYTAKHVAFARGGGPAVDIDHVVALADAWATGAAEWQASRRIALANDPLNLLAVAASANRAKGGSNAALWLPPNPEYRCAYVARQIAVKAKYGLSVTEDERDAMQKVLRGCPDEVVPEGGGPIDAPVTAAERHRSPEAPANRKTVARGVDPNYGSCKEARAHGAGPYRRGVDAEYAYYRDVDGDGVVCE